MTLPDPALQAAAETFKDILGRHYEVFSTNSGKKDSEDIIEAFLSALGGRVVVEKPCKHGYWNRHITKPDPAGSEWCPGGERTVIWEDEK